MKLYMMDVTIPPLEFFLPRVSEERIQGVKRFRFEMDKRRGLAAEALLNFGLKRLCPGLSFPLTLSRDDKGKPHLVFSEAEKACLREAGALLPGEDSIEFSLSHSGQYALCAISDRQNEGIGVDIEEHRRKMGGIAEHFFRKEETERIHSAEDFYRYWTLKESFLKAVGMGLALSLDSFEVRPSGDLAEFFYAEDPGPFFGRVYHPADGYTAAVCVRGKQELPETIESVDAWI